MTIKILKCGQRWKVGMINQPQGQAFIFIAPEYSNRMQWLVAEYSYYVGYLSNIKKYSHSSWSPVFTNQ